MEQYYSDKTTISIDEDKLNRKKFIRHFADSILRFHEGENSFVIGLLGEWGSGKSSIIDMALGEIEKSSDKPIIVKFNPWYFSGQENLFSKFFKSLALSLKKQLKHERNKEWKRIGEKIEAFGNVFLPWLPVVSIFSQGIKQFGGDDKSDVDSLKEEINNLLVKSKKTIVIIIDDIDRLTGQETKQIFQLVKSVADFKNTIYILAFDEAVVCKHLNEGTSNGQKYLEKIVQLKFNIPPISRSNVQDVLEDALKKFDEKIVYDQRWRHAYGKVLSNWILNLRDVYRFVNLVKFSLYPIKDEVNLVDFLCIRAIEIYHPNLYKEIINNKISLISQSDWIKNPQQSELPYLTGRDEQIIAKMSVDNKEYESLLNLLFQRRSNDADDLNHKRRISHEYFFDRYFQLSLCSDDLSEDEMNRISQEIISKDFSEFKQFLQEKFEEVKIQQYYNQVDFSKVPFKNISKKQRILALSNIFQQYNLLYLHRAKNFFSSIHSAEEAEQIISEAMGKCNLRLESVRLFILDLDRSIFNEANSSNVLSPLTINQELIQRLHDKFAETLENNFEDIEGLSFEIGNHGNWVLLSNIIPYSSNVKIQGFLINKLNNDESFLGLLYALCDDQILNFIYIPKIITKLKYSFPTIFPNEQSILERIRQINPTKIEQSNENIKEIYKRFMERN